MSWDLHTCVIVVIVLAGVFSALGCDDGGNGQDPTPTPRPCDPDAVLCFDANIRVNKEADGDQIAPAIDRGPEGNLYITWRDDRGEGDIYMARNTTEGESFEAGKLVHHAGNSNGPQDKPDVAVDAAGTVHVAYEDIGLPNRAGTIFVTRSSDLGQTFEAPTPVDIKARGNQSRARIATGPGDDVYVVWMDRRFLTTNIFFARSTDGGRTFETPIHVADQPAGRNYEEHPDIAVAQNGTIYVVWNDGRHHDGWSLYIARSVDGGHSFQTNVRVDDALTYFNSKPGASIAVGPSGTVHVAWNDARHGWHVFYARSDDEGRTFSPNKRLSTDYSASASPVQLETATNTIVYGVWSQSHPELEIDVMASVSLDGGAKFSDPIRINDDSESNFQAAPAIVTDGSDKIRVVWQDGRHFGHWDVYHSKGQLVTSRSQDAF